MASTEIDFIPDFEELDKKIQEQDFQTEIQADVQAQGGGAGGGGGIAEILGLTEIGSDIGTGGGPGAGIFGNIASSLSTATVLLGAAVAFLALLEPVQKAVSFIVRQFELLVIPLVSALLPVMELLQDLAVAAIRLFRNPEQFLSNIFSKIKQALAPFINAVIAGLNTVPGVNIQPVTTGQGQPRQTGFRNTGLTADPLNSKQSTVVNLLTAGAFGPFFGVSNYLLSDDAKTESAKNRQGKQTGDNFP